MSLSRLIALFVSYSFVGWVCEVIYCSILERRFVNRGFLRGPLCPVYGFGALAVVFLLEPFAHSIITLFIAATLITSAIEYATGWFLETAFRTRWWDYSSFRFNLHGRVCLLNSLLFGVMGVLGLRVLHPFLLLLIGSLPSVVLDGGVLAVSIAVCVDLSFTLRNLSGFESRLASLKDSLDRLGDLDIRENLEGLRERLRLDARDASLRLLRAFPLAVSREHGAELDVLRRLHSALARSRRVAHAGRVDRALRPALLLLALVSLAYVFFR